MVKAEVIKWNDGAPRWLQNTMQNAQTEKEDPKETHIANLQADKDYFDGRAHASYNIY